MCIRDRIYPYPPNNWTTSVVTAIAVSAANNLALAASTAVSYTHLTNAQTAPDFSTVYTSSAIKTNHPTSALTAYNAISDNGFLSNT